ncbi:MAG TPA: ATP-binding protein [Candidatus Limnocylindria bacterium]|nr:ATP-binding protein [Candidatus Limnocylindria bacterium]
MPPAASRRDPWQPAIVHNVRARVRLAFTVFLICVGISTVFEFLRFPERRPLMAVFATGFALLTAVTAAVLRRRPSWTIPALVAFVNVVGVAINVYHAMVGAPVALCVWVLTALLASSAVLLPWGRRNQALASIGVLAAYPLQLGSGGEDALAWAAGGAYLLAVVALSAFGATLFARLMRKDFELTTELSEREARLQTYFDLSLVGMAIVEPDGRCREVNEEFCRMFGGEAAHWIGRPWWEVVVAEERTVGRGMLAQALGGAPTRLDVACTRGDGTPLYATVAVRGLPGAGGRLDHALVLMHDVTERRAAELAREESLARTEAARREAEEASRAKDAFLATVSHELRTPLTPIIAWTDLLLGGVLGGEETTRALGSIQRNARAQARLIDDLLDLSRIVAREWRVEFRTVDLGLVVRAALDVTRPTADAKGVVLGSVLPAEPVLVRGDAERLQQVVWNLTANAIKFTPRGGRVDVVLAPAGGQVRLSVSDTGEGIAPAFVPHVFEPFRQADQSSGRRHGGLGLGLAIARALTECHGGSIRAESAGEGHGATFTVELPRLVEETPEQARAGDEAAISRQTVGGPRASLRGVRVLVVDDDADSNSVVAALLAARGANVRTALGTSEALAIAERWRPDVVVSDIAMPGKDGIALLRALRARPVSGGDIPAIALTAFGGADARRRLLAAGFQAHVTKPFDPVHLAAVVETAATGAGAVH